MRVDLGEIAAPAHTAIVTQECQGAVVGPNAGLAVLAEEARREAVPNRTNTQTQAAAMARISPCGSVRQLDAGGTGCWSGAQNVLHYRTGQSCAACSDGTATKLLGP
jgi:hypothetical protein